MISFLVKINGLNPGLRGNPNIRENLDISEKDLFHHLNLLLLLFLQCIDTCWLKDQASENEDVLKGCYNIKYDRRRLMPSFIQ